VSDGFEQFGRSITICCDSSPPPDQPIQITGRPIFSAAHKGRHF
jgi:hypothetical protein